MRERVVEHRQQPLHHAIVIVLYRGFQRFLHAMVARDDRWIAVAHQLPRGSLGFLLPALPRLPLLPPCGKLRRAKQHLLLQLIES
ncbi:hypothetical protein D3C84_1098180 [compost metagenome]